MHTSAFQHEADMRLYSDARFRCGHGLASLCASSCGTLQNLVMAICNLHRLPSLQASNTRHSLEIEVAMMELEVVMMELEATSSNS